MQKHIDAVERPSDREKKSLPLAISLDDLSLSRVGLGIEKRLIAASVGSAFFMARLGKQGSPTRLIGSHLESLFDPTR
ncbi:hypothetical protein B296_00004733 [Ensete ventricosum]|uniref:Uncharacterized protein n=1 Tax=Ensete ventricosum TaxID=4639 RepID=A0A427AFJ9_ENSVE|nr:hypothetical protein B296_00004733 [Ensete ventricosum]